MLVGTSVATASARRGHYYSGRGNRFWTLLWEAGLTGTRPLEPDEDASVLRFGVGLTDLVKGRAASSDRHLGPGDFDLPGFVDKVERFAPIALAFNGKRAAEQVFRVLGLPKPALGPSEHRVGGAPVFVLPSSSGANNDPRRLAPHTKVEWWARFGAWVETAETVPGRRVVVACNDAINEQRVDVLERLMADDHRFVDSAGGSVVGRAACVDAWRSFFAAFPDYRNVFESFERTGDGTIEVVGHSHCSDARLRGPARWLVRTQHGLVTEWRVCDP